jgi:hypothetical protein
MAINKLDSIDTVINKVIRDLGLGENEIPYQDFVEWCAEALEDIGSYTQFEDKKGTIVIENYEGMLPCDLYKVVKLDIGCEINPTDGGFYGGSLLNELNKAGVDYESFGYESFGAYTRFRDLAVPGLVKPQNQYASTIEITRKLSHNPNLSMYTHTTLDYNVNFNQITTSFECGLIDIQYLAFPVDDRGYPLIPDNQSFRTALFWKIAYQLSIRNPKCIPNPVMQDPRYTKDEWNKYCMQARASANMPDLDGMIRLKNNWLRLHNTTDDDMDNFRSLGKQQRLNLDGRL